MLQVLQAEHPCCRCYSLSTHAAGVTVSAPMLQVLQAMLHVLQAELHELCRVLRAEQSPGQQGELPDCLLQQQIRLN